MIPIALLAVVFTGTDSSLPSVETIRDSYLSALTPIVTFDCEMHLEFEALKPGRLQKSAVRYVGANLHLWRKGAWRALSVENINSNHQPVTANWYGFDGNLYGSWTKRLGPTEEQDWLPGGRLQAEKINNLYELFTVDRLTGETLGAGDLPLSALLQDPGAKVVGRKVISGVTCLELAFPRHMPSRMAPELKTVETTVWLDPDHGYLPRLIHRRTHYPDSTPSQLHEFETTEFGTFVGDDKQTYTLPVAGENRNSMTKTRLTLVRATINGPLSDDLFKPAFPPLTEVLKTLPNQPPHRDIVGDSRERQRAHDEIIGIEFKRKQERKALSIPVNLHRHVPAMRVAGHRRHGFGFSPL